MAHNRIIAFLFRAPIVAAAVAVTALSTTALSTSTNAAEPTLAGRTLGEWREQVVSDDDVRRVYATLALTQFTPVPVVDLAKSTRDPNATVRYWSVKGLNRSKTTKESPEEGLVLTCLKRAMDDPSAAVRIEAARGLALRGESEVALSLLKNEMANQVDGVRIQAVSAVEELGPLAKPLRELLDSAADDRSEYVKRIAARILGSWNEQ